MKKIQIQLVLAAVTLILTACGSVISESPLPPFKDTEWTLISLNGNSLIKDTQITIEFGPERFNGFTGCNYYGEKYTATGKGALSISEIAATERLCPTPEGIMEQEALYLQSLQEAASYRISGNLLEIFNAAGERALVFSRR